MAVISGGSFSNASFNKFTRLSLPMIDDKIRDAIFDDSVHLQILDSKGSVRRNQTGEGIILKFRTAKMNTIARTMRSPIPLEAKNLHDFGYQEYAQYTDGTPIDWLVENQNAGKERIIAYLDEETDVLKRTHVDTINTDMMTGSGTLPTLTGMTALIAETVSSGIIHGIPRLTNTWVRNQIKDSDCSTTLAFGIIVLKEILDLQMAAATGPGKNAFKLGLMNATTYANMFYYMPDYSSNQRIIVNGNAKTPGADIHYDIFAGFYVGETFMYWDHAAPADSIRFFNPENITVYIVKNCDNKIKQTEAYNSFAHSLLIGSALAQVNNNPKRTGVIFNFNS